jgi:conjugative relaxase-like TrwC/TraI family protein
VATAAGGGSRRAVTVAWGAAVVLTVAKVTAAAAAGYANYLEGRSQAPEAGDYYLSDGGERVEAPGRWMLGPRGVEVLGVDVSRVVAAEAFRAVMHVQHPTSGEMLRRVGGNGEAVCAIDATFSAPKSVSAVWALSSPELRAQLEAAQEAAVDRALSYATERVPMIRRRVDQSTVVRERAGEVLASSWRHTTARAVAGRAPDPQLHSHVLVHGAVREDGRVVAVESRAWLVHQREVDAAYLSELAQGLERLGFSVQRETGRRERYFELVGVPEGLRERFSGRHAQVQAAIEQRLAEKTAELQAAVTEGGSSDAAIAAEQLEALQRSGRLLPAEERAVAMRSRATKTELLLTAGDLDRAWWQDAQPYNFDVRSVEQLRSRGPAVKPLSGEDLDRRVLERLTEFDATFTDRDVRAAALVAGVGLDVDEALGAVDRLTARGELLELADGRLTTRQHRQMEGRTVARARAVAAGQVGPVDPELTEREIAVLDAQLRQAGADGLAGDQAHAIRIACAAGQLVVIEGQAGTGKSTALGAVARAHEHAGQRVVVTSTGALAAERLATELREAGVEADGYSTMALQARVSSGVLELGAGVTVIHDEAALASTREQDWLFGAVEASRARLILVGDPRQSQAVGAGGLWDRIEAAVREHDAHVALRRIVRAQDPADRRDQSLWRAGQHDRALAGYTARGRLVLADAQARTEDRALESAHADRQQGRSTLVVAQTSNEHLDELNARAQAIRIQHDELGVQEVALSGGPHGLRAGDEVQVRHPVTHPELGRVSNGTTAQVLDVDDDGEHATLALSDGRHGTFDRELLDAAQARLAYVQHPFPAQGATVDTAHVICGEHATAEGSYVALTRARSQTHIYAGRDRLDELEPDADRQAAVEAVAQRMGRSDPELPSIAVALAHEQRVEAEHARESQPTRPADEEGEQRSRRERDELAELRQERDRLRAIVDSYPTQTAREIALLQDEAAGERQRAEGDAWRSEHWQDQYDRLGILRRRGQDGRQARQRADRFAQQADAQRQHAEQLEGRTRALADSPDGPGAWERAHPDARERLYAAETALAAAVDQRTRGRSGPATEAAEGFDRQAAHRELVWLRAERDRLRDQLRSYPHQPARDADQADKRAEMDARDAQADRQRAQQAEREYEQMGRLARRGKRGTQAQERQQTFEDRAQHHTERARSERQAAQRAREQPGGPAEWDRAHPGVRERLAVYEDALEFATAQQAQRAVEIAVGRDPAMRVLGPRPRHPDNRKVWDRGAEAISAYRLAYGITDQDTVLGQEPNRRGAEGFEQHADWEHAAKLALQARRKLGIDPGRGLGPVSEQARRVPELTPPELDRGRNRGLGFGL